MKQTFKKIVRKKDDDKNRFRFKTFNERVSGITIGVARRVDEVQDLDEDAETYFHQGLQKWRELNCTTHFSDACRQLPHAHSLPQVIHNQVAMVNALQKNLLVPNTMALQPLLDLVLQLARDLQSDFYVYFQDFFKIFVTLLNTNDPETIEQVFTTLAYLVKFLWHCLLQQISTVFSYYKVLLSSSQKPYIVAFAAESFAFLIRKLKKRKHFVSHVASLLEDDTCCQGVGVLLFESVKGVRMQFHSSTELLLSAWLPFIGHPSNRHDNEDMVLEALLRCMQEMAEYTRQEHCSFIWPLLLGYVNTIMDQFVAADKAEEQKETAAVLWAHVERVLRLVQKWVNWRWGYRMSDPALVFKCINNVLKSATAIAASSASVQDVVVDLVHYGRPFDADMAKPVVQKVISHLNCCQVLEFSHRLISLGPKGFEVVEDIPHIVEQYAIDEENYPTLLVFLAKLSRKFQDEGSGDEQQMFNLKGMPGTAKMITTTCQPVHVGNGKNAALDTSYTNIHRIWCVASAVHICRSLPSQAQVAKSLHIWRCGIVASCNRSKLEESSSLSFGLSAVVKALALLQGASTFVESCSVDWVLELLRESPSDIHTLNTVLVVLDAIAETEAQEDCADTALTLENLSAVFEEVRPNLSHPMQPVRLATLQILSRFPQPLLLGEDTEDGMETSDVIQQCLDAQESEATLNGFRDKIRLLDLLKYIPSKQEQCPVIYKEVALRYLVGCLYINFQPIWSPVSESIASYATPACRKMFWKVYNEHLEISTKRCTTPPTSLASDTSDSVQSPMTMSAVFQEGLALASPTAEENRVDHLNFRMLLWRAMALFTSSAEASTRYIVPIFLSFVQDEYSFLDDAVLKHQDLRPADHLATLSHVANMQAEGTDDLDSVETDMEKDDDPNDSCVGPAQDSTKKQNRRALFKTLSTMLTLFSKFVDPRSAHKEAEMKHLMLQLLCHREEDIQRLALQYIMAYKLNFLLPYRENLFDLLKETGFREALTHFSVDEENSPVRPEHREQLLPFLIRIIYGRMLRNTGMATTGKQGSALRRGVVLRFLAGCPGEEMKVFVQLITAPFQSYFPEDCEVSCDGLPALDISSVVPLRKQQGFLMMLGQMFSNLRTVLPPYLPHLLRITLCIASWTSQLLKLHRCRADSGAGSQVDARAGPMLRTIRQLVLARLAEAFASFQHYDFQPYIKAVLEVAVWPQLSALPTECLDHPTPLMKLLLGWSQRQRFLRFFSMPTPDDMDGSILHFVFSCLKSSAVRPPVISTIMQIVDNLLNNGDEQDADSIEPRAKRTMVATSAEATVSEQTEEMHVRGNIAAAASSSSIAKRSQSDGEKLLLPHMHVILEHLGSFVVRGSTIGSESSSSKRSSSGKQAMKVPLQYLTTLSRMSEFVDSPALSEKLVKAFLPLASKSQIYGDALSNVLLTCSRLLLNIKDTTPFVLPLSRLFGCVKVRAARNHLCKAFQVIGGTNPELKQAADIATNLNSWDPKRLEEPDFERRLDAFKSSGDFLSSASEPMVILALVHNALFTVHQSEDIALRDAACHFLHLLVKKLATVLDGPNSDMWMKEMLNTVVMTALQQGVRSKSETVRHEFVSLLSESVRSLSHVCPRLANLQSLHNSDIEMDFFENIRHIQMHRRTNALRSLASRLDEGCVPAVTVATFVLPLASAYLMVSTSDHNLVSQAVAVLAAVAKQSPWSRYRSLLQRYLRLLVKGSDQQKTHIRVVVAILESFHFDVKSVSASLYEEDSSIAPVTTPALDVVEDIDEDMPDEQIEEEAAAQESRNALAKRIFHSLRRDIIPELDRALSKKSAVGGSHHLSSQESENAELIVCMPVALAIVKLFQKLPEEVMHSHLPSVLLKVCNVLKSRSKDVRDTARQSLVKISSSLGPRYLSWVIKELRSALNRGYQLHVLGHAVHAILDTLVTCTSAGEIDDSVSSIMQVIKEDLFGDVAEERDVGKIADKIPEARASRSRLSLQLLAQIISGEELNAVINPIKEVLKTTHSLKVVHSIEECLRHISLGLLANSALPITSLLVMVHGVCSQNNSGLGMIAGRNVNSNFMPAPKEEKRPTRPDLYASHLLPAAPVRGAKAPGASKLTNMHVMIEFSLQLLLTCFKRSSINTSDQEILQMLDPLSPLLASFLGSQHIKLLSVSLRCLVHLLPLPLPAMESHVSAIVKHLFKVLKEYSVAGAALGNNHEMVIAGSKAMTTIVRSYKKHKITSHQLELLMTYVEEDIHDFSRKGTAFPLLKAILSRKLDAPVVHDTMTKVLDLLVTADVPTVQLNCRQAMIQYLLDYSLGKKVQKHVNFLLKHLEYELESGRESVLEMLNLIFSRFPPSVISVNCGLFFVTIAPRLINDDSVTCRKLAALTIQSLLEKVEDKDKDSLFSIVLLWLNDKTLLLRRLGYLLASTFISMEGNVFERRLAQFLPLLRDTLLMAQEEEDEDDEHVAEDAEISARDHVIFTALTCLVKLIMKSRLLSSDRHTDVMNSIWGAIQQLLRHPHAWVRLYSCRLFGFLFAHIPADQLVSGEDSSKTKTSSRKRSHASSEELYLVSSPAGTISRLARSFLSQLSSDEVTSELSQQVIKNLVYVARVLCLSKTASNDCAEDGEDGDDLDEDEDSAVKLVDLAWLVNRMIRIAKYEAGHSQRQSAKRTCVLRWLAALTQILHEHGGLDVYLTSMLSPVIALVNDKTKLAGAELHGLAEAVLEEMRSKAGREVFSAAASQAELAIREQRDKRRQQRLLQNVANPELAARRKLKLNNAKREAKKRKLALGRTFTRKRRS